MVGRSLAIRKPSQGSRAARLATKVAFDSPPAGPPGTDYLTPLRSWARSSPALIEVGLGSFDARGPWGPGDLPNPRQRVEFVMPPGDADAVWEAMRQLARRKVKKARKSEFEISRPVSAAELAPFTEVYEVTQARLERDKGYVAGFELDRENFAAALAELTTRDRGRLYAASRGGRLEAAVFMATFGERAYMVYSSATDEGRELGAPFLVLFEALHELREDGFSVLNLGGAAGDAADPSSSEHGLHQFKTRFGAEVVPHTSGVLQPRPGRARVVRSVRRLVRL
ncbi:MAG TPA: GNAT family N-acetyltransferase [Solirubrobacterales bacterium]|nr:GNAT family N-acetyltransferase [Solirubrobacterales bacterium]